MLLRKYLEHEIKKREAELKDAFQFQDPLGEIALLKSFISTLKQILKEFGDDY